MIEVSIFGIFISSGSCSEIPRDSGYLVSCCQSLVDVTVKECRRRGARARSRYVADEEDTRFLSRFHAVTKWCNLARAPSNSPCAAVPHCVPDIAHFFRPCGGLDQIWIPTLLPNEEDFLPDGERVETELGC